MVHGGKRASFELCLGVEVLAIIGDEDTRLELRFRI